MPEIKYPSEWLKINNNVVAGDHIRFMDVGEFDEGKGTWEFSVSIIHEGAVVETKKFTLNKTNFKVVSELYGTNSDNWKGKLMKVNSVKTRNPQTGGLVDSIALEAPDPQLVAADNAGVVAK